MPEVILPDVLSPLLSAWAVESSAFGDVVAALPDGSVLAVAVPSSGLPATGLTADLLAAAGRSSSSVAETHEPTSAAGDLTRVPLGEAGRHLRTVLLVGIGDGSPDALRKAGAALGRAARGSPAVATSMGSGLDAATLGAFVEGVVLGGWASPRWSATPSPKDRSPVGVVRLLGEGAVSIDRGVVDRAAVRARATAIARGLGVVPSNIKNPAWLAAQARTLARRNGLKITVWDDRDLRREGFGGLLAVGGGSATPPRFVRLDHRPAGAEPDARPVVLVGKGITFDTGGLDIKPAEGMLAMKTDMLGSAIVLAVLAACKDLGVRVPVTGLLCLAENAVSGSAYRPSDVLTQFGGRTVEIGNTDAEGRIVLADGLAYADAHLDPAVLIDIATLTGAARVALDRTMAPVYSTDDDLRRELVAAGEATGEPLWPFPLVEDYRRALDSDFADLSHIAPKVGAGSITAALFLREFAGTRPWAHLDIAGVGRSDVDRGILSKGATAFGARLLLAYLEVRR